MSVKGLPHIGIMDNGQAGSESTWNRFEYANVFPVSNTSNALSNLAYSVYYHIEDEPFDVGCTTTDLVYTNHGCKRGDFVRFRTANFREFEVVITEIIDANTFRIAGALEVAPTNSDRFDVLRPILPLVTPTGATLATVQSGPISFNLDGNVEEVTEDTATPANNIPLPVKLMGVNGTINLTADDLNVQLSHIGATPDSVRIGDGTNLMGVNASLEALTHDADVLAALNGIAGQNPATLGQKDMANSFAVVIASDQSPVDVEVTASVLPPDAATETTLNDILNGIGNLELVDYATETTLQGISGKLPLVLGKAADADSLSVTLSTEGTAILTAIETAVETIEDAIDGTEMQVDIVDPGPLLTETTFQSDIASLEAEVTAISAQLPATLGAKTSANSLSITLATDESALPVAQGANENATNAFNASVNSSSPITLSTPADAVGFVLANDPASDEIVNYTLDSTNPTNGAGGGIPLLPASNTGFIPCAPSGNVKVIARNESSGTATVSIVWIRN